MAEEGRNPGRTTNKVRENLRAVLSWAREQDLLETLPRFPKPRPQRDVAGRHDLTKTELNALYFATHKMKRPRGWRALPGGPVLEMRSCSVLQLRTRHGHDPSDPVFLGRGARPNARFKELCGLAGVKPKMDVETGEERPWLLKDVRKTCATYYDVHVPESSIEILGHSVGGVTYRHYAHRDPG